MLPTNIKIDWDGSPLDDLKRELNINYHTLSVNEMCKIFQTHPDNGLNNQLAQKILANEGPNRFSAVSVLPEWVQYIKHWFNGFALLVWLCMFLAIIINFLRNWTEDVNTVFSLAIIVLRTSVYQYALEPSASNVIDYFNKLIPRHAHVIRDGKNMEISAQDLVVGDLIELEGGDTIPADIRLIYTNNFKINNRAITGVNELVELTTEYTSLNPLETLNLAFLSAIAVDGFARGIVIGCGDSTGIGRTAALVASLSPRKSPMEKDILYVIRVISFIALFTSLFLTVIAFLLLKYNVADSIELLVNAITSLIPEGLIITLIICLTLFVAISSNENILFKNIYAVASLGSVSIIFTEKTGTLTMNDLSVLHVWLNLESEPIHINIFLETPNLRTFELKALFLVVIICNDYDFSIKFLNEPLRNTIFDLNDICLLKCAAKFYENGQAIKQDYPKVAEISLNEKNKCRLSIHQIKKTNGYMLAIKGNPENVLDFCSTTIVNEEEIEIDNDFKILFKNIVSGLENLGENLIAFGDFYLPATDYPPNYNFNLKEPNFPLKNYRFLGILSLTDPTRSDISDAISKIRSAGVRIIMCSGDSATKSKVVAKEAGIILAENETIEDIAQRLDISLTEVNPIDATAAVINCSDFGNFSTDKLEYLLKNYEDLVFARTTPQQKFQIVQSCQNLGALVGVIGNDINDCLAIKQADVGISMGRSSNNNVADEVADIVLTGNSYSLIVEGIESGRLIFENLKKIVVFILITNASEFLEMLLNCFLGNPYGIRPILTILMEMGFNILPSISLCFERAEEKLLGLKPRNPYTDRLVNFRTFILCYGMLGMIASMGAMTAYLTVMHDNGFSYQNVNDMHNYWRNTSVNDLKDSEGFEWTSPYRAVLLQTAHTAYFIGVAENQWAALIVCKRRINSIFKETFKNLMLNMSLIITGVLVCFIIYWPTSYKVGIYPLHLRWWLPALPFAAVMIIFDECRKKVIRTNPQSWIAKNTFY